MTRIVVCLSLALAAAAPASGYCRPYGGRAGYSLPEESAAKVIAEYKRASGGNGPFKSLIMTGTLVTADGAAGTFSLHTAAPDHLRVDIDAPGLKLYECYNGKSAWRVDTRGLRTLLGSQAGNLKLYALLENTRLRGLSRYRVEVATTGDVAPGGVPEDAVTATLGEGSVRLFFNRNTHLLDRLETGSPDGPEIVTYSDYRKTDAGLEPYSIEIKDGEAIFKVTLQRIERDRPFDSSLFDYPKMEGSAPVPDVESLLKSIVANQERIEELKEHYTFQEHTTERVLDGGGRIKQTKESVYEVTPVANSYVRRRVSEDGKALSQSAQEKEDKRVQKEVEDIVKRHEKREKQEAEGKQRNRITVLDFLRTSDITSVRRETLDGQEVVAFDFEPRKGFKPRNMAENLINKLEGTIWVDEIDHQVARVEAHLTNSFKLGGGLLASVGRSTAFEFEQKKVDGEVWLPSHTEANVSAKVMLLARFNRSFTTTFSDYKKYKIDSNYKLQEPKQN